MSDRAAVTGERSLALALAEALAAATPENLPLDVLHHAHRAVLDWFGSVVAGSFEAPARMAQRVAARMGTSNDATIVGAGRGSAAAAAFANGVASHILELDDIHKGSTIHGAAPIVPAALAVAEREHAGGAAFLTAVAVGYEAALRIGAAVNPSHYRYWHPTGTAATFGSAAAASWLLRSTAAQMADALGSAGTQAAGLWEFNADGAMSKHLHPGKAAMNGVLAADLAREGFTGARRILEGERGFFRAMAESFDAARVADGLGTRWSIGENGYKLHACCGHTHAAIDAAIDLRRARGWTAEDVVAIVERVDVETYGPGYEIVKETTPRTPYQGKFSMAYCVAAALAEGEAGLAQFTADRFGADGVREPRISALVERTRVAVADDLTRRYPQCWPARVAISLRTGERLQASADYPRGNAENPVTTRELEAKLAALVTPRIGGEAARDLLRLVAAIPAAADMGALLRSLPPIGSPALSR